MKSIDTRNYLKKNMRQVQDPFCNRALAYLPLCILIMYIVFGYVCYRICPMEWPLRNDRRTLVYIVAVVVALFAGYVVALINLSKKQYQWIDFPVNTFYNQMLIAGFILYLPTSYYRTGRIIPPIIEGILNPGKQYFEILQLIENRPGIFNLLGCFYIITYAVIILTYFFWDRLNRKQRVIGGILFALYFMLELCVGKNIGIVTLATSLSVCCFAKLCGKNTKKNKVCYAISAFLLICLMVLFFSYVMKSRTGYSVENEQVYLTNKINSNQTETDATEEVVSHDEQISELLITLSESDKKAALVTYHFYKELEEEYGDIFAKSVDDIFYDYLKNNTTVSDYYRQVTALSYVHVDNELYTKIPDSLKFLYQMGTLYMSNGYHGLSQALYLPWDCTYGLGHLKTVQYYLDKLFGITGDIPTYENKLIENGWPVGLVWCTAFVQFASDFSFAGTIVLMFIMGWLLAKLWLEVVAGGNFISVILFSFYCVQFFFITSWWYAGLTGGYFITFYVPLLLWILQKIMIRKYNKK